MRARGLRETKTGAYTVIQRFSGPLALNVHIHSLLLPPKGKDLIRYHGVLAPGSRLRTVVVPGEVIGVAKDPVQARKIPEHLGLDTEELPASLDELGGLGPWGGPHAG